MVTTGCRIFARAALALLCLAAFPAALAQTVECLTHARSTISPGAWEAAHAYFQSLTVGDSGMPKARLIRLKAAIVQLEGAKQQLIDIAEAQMRAGAHSAALASDLSLARVPPLLQEIESLTRSLRALALAAGLHAAEPAFRQLVLHVDGKRANVQCNPRRPDAAGPGGSEAIQRLVAEIRTELGAIGKAEDALGSHIRRLR